MPLGVHRCLAGETHAIGVVAVLYVKRVVRPQLITLKRRCAVYFVLAGVALFRLVGGIGNLGSVDCKIGLPEGAASVCCAV